MIRDMLSFFPSWVMNKYYLPKMYIQKIILFIRFYRTNQNFYYK